MGDNDPISVDLNQTPPCTAGLMYRATVETQKQLAHKTDDAWVKKRNQMLYL